MFDDLLPFLNFYSAFLCDAQCTKVNKHLLINMLNLLLKGNGFIAVKMQHEKIVTDNI